MQDLENDMDDLFRRAAEKYPLNTGQSNWESVEKKLSVVPHYEEPKQPKRKNNYKKLWLLLLLIGISLLTGFLILNPIHKNSQAEIHEHQTIQNDALNNNQNTKENAPINHLLEISNGTNDRESNNKKSKISKANPQLNKKNADDSNESKKINKNHFSGKNAPEPGSGIKLQNNNVSGQKPDDTATGTAVHYPELKNKTSLPETIENKPDTETKKSSDTSSTSSEKKKAPSAKKRVKKETGFYAGFIGGPDFSKVKSSAFSNPGFSVGILAGYNINKNLFIETGFLSDTKYYSSDGKMFDMKSASMPDGMIVNDLESRSKILEIPLNIGYRFYNRNKTNLYAAGGFATYLMTHEKNNYNITENGTPGKMEGNYEKNDLTMPAVFNISIGWEQHLSGLLKIRMEPYLKLPVQGIGVGKLPVTSAGIQVGLVRDFN